MYFGNQLSILLECNVFCLHPALSEIWVFRELKSFLGSLCDASLCVCVCVCVRFYFKCFQTHYKHIHAVTHPQVASIKKAESRNDSVWFGSWAVGQ